MFDMRFLSCTEEYFKFIYHIELFKSSNDLSDKLISIANKNVNQSIEVWLTNYFIIGHTVGICETSDKRFHFIDANRGYYRFRDASVFKEWFAKYVHWYPYVFHAAMVTSHSIYLKKSNKKNALDYALDVGKAIYFFIAAILSAAVIITASIFLLMFKVLAQPLNVYRYVQAKKALTSESTQMLTKLWPSFNVEGNREHLEKINKSSFFAPAFNEESLLKIKTISEPIKHNSGGFLNRFSPKISENTERKDSRILVPILTV